MVRLVYFRRGLLLIVGAAGAAFVLWVLTQGVIAHWKSPASQFPMPVPGTDLVILQVLPYTGEYLESAPTDMVTELAAICLQNTGALPIQFASVDLQTKAGTYTFQVDAGETIVFAVKAINTADTMSVIVMVSPK